MSDLLRQYLQIRAASNREALSSRLATEADTQNLKNEVRTFTENKTKKRSGGILLPRSKREIAAYTLNKPVTATIIHAGNGIYTPGVGDVDYMWQAAFTNGQLDPYAGVDYFTGIVDLYSLRTDGVQPQVSAASLLYQINQVKVHEMLVNLMRYTSYIDKNWLHVITEQFTNGEPIEYTHIGLQWYGISASIEVADQFPVDLPGTWKKSFVSPDNVYSALSSTQLKSTLVFLTGHVQQSFYHFGPAFGVKSAPSPSTYVPPAFYYTHDSLNITPSEINGSTPIGIYSIGTRPPGPSTPSDNFTYTGRDARKYTSRPSMSKLFSTYDFNYLTEFQETKPDYQLLPASFYSDPEVYFRVTTDILANRAKYVVQRFGSTYVFDEKRPYWQQELYGLILPFVFYAGIEAKPVRGTVPGAVGNDTEYVVYRWFVYMVDNNATYLPFLEYTAIAEGIPSVLAELSTSMASVRAFYPKTYLASLLRGQ